MRRCVWLLLAVLGCQSTPGPEDVLAGYRSALARGDFEAAYALTDERFRTAHDFESFRSYASAHPEEVERFLARWAMRGPAEHVTLGAPGAGGAGGASVSLTLEGGVWRIAGGGVEPPRTDDPLGALRAFFDAVRAEQWSRVRSAIPEARAAQYNDDNRLAEHIANNRTRIDAARSALDDLSGRVPRIKGDEAELVYGAGRSVRWVRESGTWRIVDLE